MIRALLPLAGLALALGAFALLAAFVVGDAGNAVVVVAVGMTALVVARHRPRDRRAGRVR